MKKITQRVYVLGIIIIFIIFGLLYSETRVAGSQEKSELVRVDMRGVYSLDGGEWIEFSSIDQFEEKNAHKVEIKGFFNSNIPSNEVLYLFPRNLEITMKVNGDVVYEFLRTSEISQGTGQGIGVINTGTIRTNDTVEFEITNPWYQDKNFQNMMKNFLSRMAMGEGEEIYKIVLRDCTGGIFLTALIFFISLILMFITGYTACYNIHIAKQYAVFTFFSFVCSWYVLVDTLYFYMPIFFKSPVWCNILSVIPVYLLTLSASLYFYVSTKSEVIKKILVWCTNIMFVITILAMGLQLFGIKDIYPSQNYFLTISALVLLVGVVGTICDGVIYKNSDIFALVRSFTPIFIGGAIQYFDFYFNFWEDRSLMPEVITLSLILQTSHLIHVVYQLTKEQEAKEKEYLKKQEENMRQLEIINGLASDYNSVYYLDLDNDSVEVLRLDKHGNLYTGIDFETYGKYEKSIESYANLVLEGSERKRFIELTSLENLREQMNDSEVFSFVYKTIQNGEEMYFQLKAVKVGEYEKNKKIVIGFSDITEETKEKRKQQEALEIALEQAQQASKAKGTFLSNMSHDIRTPMNAIIGFATLAAGHIDNTERVKDCLKKIMSSSNHLLSLINDVLDMSRIESGKITIEEKPCSLSEIFHDLKTIIQGEIKSKQLEMYIDTVDVFDEDIFCDKLRMNQMFLNLLSNAIKFSKPGGIISVRIIQRKSNMEDYGSYEFRVKDTGVGMTPDFIEHIFEPFSREKSSTVSGIQGTGLGMAITKNIVDMMGGTITVNSELGKGTEFVVNIDFRIQKEKHQSVEIKELEGLRALVVDDDFNTCDSVTHMLMQVGMRAEWTMSGSEAILRTRQAISRSDEFYTYIIDWIMPDMNGIELTRRIRKEVGDSCPIVILTAYDWSDIEEEAKEAGVTAFCSKPMFMSDLRNTLLNAAGLIKEEETEEAREYEKFIGKKILLVEDNELNREIATEILQDYGFVVDYAEDGTVAVQKMQLAKREDYDIILMDIQMPLMNGYEATREIRQIKEAQDIPIIAMTANAFDEDKRKAFESGMNGYISKPIEIEKLLETLEKTIE